MEKGMAFKSKKGGLFSLNTNNLRSNCSFLFLQFVPCGCKTQVIDNMHLTNARSFI